MTKDNISNNTAIIIQTDPPRQASKAVANPLRDIASMGSATATTAEVNMYVNGTSLAMTPKEKNLLL